MHWVKILIILVAIIILGTTLLSTEEKASNPQVSIFINGTQITMDVNPSITGGRVLVPARYIAESLGAKVDWDASKKAVIIYQSEEQKISSDRIPESGS